VALHGHHEPVLRLDALHGAVVAPCGLLQAGREVRQRSVKAALDYQIALADLERAMGTPLK